MNIKNTAAAIVLTTVSMTARAQHEISVNVGGGLSTLSYNSGAPNYKTSSQFGATAGVGYTYFFNDCWGIGTGAEAALFNGVQSLSAFAESYAAHDGSRNFEYRYELTDFSETQRSILLNIPLMMRFRTGKFYAALGCKIGIPVGATFDNRAASLRATGYYADKNLTLDEPEYMGFGTFYNLKSEGDWKMKTAVFASAEAGLRFDAGERNALYLGVYLDYGTNDVKPDASTALIAYAGNRDYRPNTLTASTTAGKASVEKVFPFAVGLKVSFAFGGKKSPEKQKPTLPVLQE